MAAAAEAATAAAASAAKVAAKKPELTVSQLGEWLCDEKQPIAKRMRCCFKLRQMGGHAAIDALAAAVGSPSVLLGHEIAFVLGQMQDPYAVPFLTKTLENREINAIVRHEAAEALGAIALDESIPILEKYATDASVEVADTCRLALDRIKWNVAQRAKAEAKAAGKEEGEGYESKYSTVDPAPALRTRDTETLRKVLCDTSLSMFERYRAMFALRNRGDTEAVLALATGFEDASAVFRHEIAYVMGQLQHKAAVPSLTKALMNVNEHAMVRHEAAEALGSIGEEESSEVLAKYQRDGDKIVSESCDVALDIVDYWNEAAPADGSDDEADDVSGTKH